MHWASAVFAASARPAWRRVFCGQIGGAVPAVLWVHSARLGLACLCRRCRNPWRREGDPQGARPAFNTCQDGWPPLNSPQSRWPAAPRALAVLQVACSRHCITACMSSGVGTGWLRWLAPLPRGCGVAVVVILVRARPVHVMLREHDQFPKLFLDKGFSTSKMLIY